MLNIGIIGAGTISTYIIEHFVKSPECTVKSIADLNIELAKKRAEEYGIANFYSDYHEIINDAEINAVCILTPTFTHKDIILEAVKNNKHIYCEKPPALNADEVRMCEEAVKDYDKCLMYGLVCRFKSEIKYLKEYIDSGKMGKIICAEASRLGRMIAPKGWFGVRKLGGGALIDEAIHQLDMVLYLMNYPKVKSVTGFVSFVNNNLPKDIKGAGSTLASCDINKHEIDTESVIKAFINFENGSNLVVKSSHVLNTFDTGAYFEINGEKAGARYGNELKMLEITDDNYLREVSPILKAQNSYETEVNHFINCCLGKEECITPITDAIKLMEIIDAIYKSAETGETIIFN